MTIVPLVLLAGPLLALTAYEIWLRARSRSSRPYLRFLVVGAVHGAGIWALFLWSEWRPNPSSYALLVALAGALMVAGVFACVYLFVVGLIELASRYLRRQ